MPASSVDFARSRQLLQSFEFGKLFIEVLGWSNPTEQRAKEVEVDGMIYQRRMIAQVAGVPVYEVGGPEGRIPGETVRRAIQEQTAEISLEHLLIFVDSDRSQSLWYWVKRDGKQRVSRQLSYYRGQSGDLILGKLSGLVFELEDFEAGDPAVVDTVQRLQAAFDVERVTKKFYGDFKGHLEWFVGQIEGIEDPKDRRWYASVILNRLMFVYFLQYKGFVDGNLNYLRDKLEQFEAGSFYLDFLRILFFQGFAKAEGARSPEVRRILGQIKYLNGGLFLEHRIERDHKISMPNVAFERTLDLFEKYSWNLDDMPGGKDDEIRPEVLGYIFEKYINQKEFGAYYTRPEITEYLCDRTINKLVLDKVNQQAKRQFESIEDLLFNLDADLCWLLVNQVLPRLSLLDPACGSGAFLVAAMKTLIKIYSAIVGRIKFLKDSRLTAWLAEVEAEHPSIQYYIKKRIITDNLYGVDIMEEATEITKLRLFLALVASAAQLEELEPLPNVDFNIMAGNSLIGLIRVDATRFDAVEETSKAKNRRRQQEQWGVESFQPNLLGEAVYVQPSLLQPEKVSRYQRILEEKNASIRLYKEHSFLKVDQASDLEQADRVEQLRDHIQDVNEESQRKLNQLLWEEFQELKIKVEEAQLTGKAKKRQVELGDVERLKPFHWGYHFDQVIMERGGFDAIIANPPWEVFKPNAKEFFAQHSELVTKKKMDIKAFEKQQKELLKDGEIAAEWAEYQSQFPHVSAYFRSADQFKNQISVVNGKKAGTDINLYKLFLELCFNLLKPFGYCGIIIPTGFYTDLGTKQLREMIFSEAKLDTLLGLSNEKFVFEGVHHSVKFCLLTFEKGGSTDTFDACFRINPREAIRPNELEYFLADRSQRVQISVPLVRQLSPDSVSVMEFRSDFDIAIVQKLLKFPLLSENINGSWNFILSRELDRGNDNQLFQLQKASGAIPLFVGKMFNQFCLTDENAPYYVPEVLGRKEILGKKEDSNQKLDYQNYRWVHRRIARNTDTRTLITTIAPKNIFCDNNSTTLNLEKSGISNMEMIFLCGVCNSFSVDWLLRQKVSSTLNMFYIYQLPVPRLTKTDRAFQEIVDRAAKLICTTPEFDDLAKEVGLGNHTNGVTDETERAKLRAELDGIIAHLYHLTESEFAHILSTFPIVPQATKDAALQAYRDLAPIPGDPEILTLIQQGESSTVEFKSTARWNLIENKKDRTMEEVILKTIAAFLNSQGGTLLIGVADDNSIVGLEPDYQAFKGKKNRDGYELWLMNDLVLKEFGKAIAPYLTITFHTVDSKDICKIAIAPAPEPVYVEIRDKSGQPQETLFIRTGNSTNKLDKPSEIQKYLRQRWPGS